MGKRLAYADRDGCGAQDDKVYIGHCCTEKYIDNAYNGEFECLKDSILIVGAECKILVEEKARYGAYRICTEQADLIWGEEPEQKPGKKVCARCSSTNQKEAQKLCIKKLFLQPADNF
jgi:hypothetical protein